MTVSDETKEADGLKGFFESVGKAIVGFGKKVANNTVRALKIASKIGSAAASRNPKTSSSATSDLIKFATTGEVIRVVQKGSELYLGTKKKLFNCRSRSIICEAGFLINIKFNIIITKYMAKHGQSPIIITKQP